MPGAGACASASRRACSGTASGMSSGDAPPVLAPKAAPRWRRHARRGRCWRSTSTARWRRSSRDPSDARVRCRGRRRGSRALAGCLPVAIVTGRAVDDLRARLGFEPHVHRRQPRRRRPDRKAAPPMTARAAMRCAPACVAHAERAEERRRRGRGQGRIRSRCTTGSRRDRAAARRCIDGCCTTCRPGLHVFGGKMVVNVVVAGAPDKGDALPRSWLARAPTRDVRRRRRQRRSRCSSRAEPDWLTVRIGRDDPLSKADFFLDSYAEVATLLQLMLDLLSPS